MKRARHSLRSMVLRGNLLGGAAATKPTLAQQHMEDAAAAAAPGHGRLGLARRAARRSLSRRQR